MSGDTWRVDDDQSLDGTAGDDEPNGVDDRSTAAERGRAAFSNDHGRLRSWFKRRSERYTGLERQLAQARLSTAVDAYLAESAVASLKAALGGAMLITVVLTVVALADAFIFEGAGLTSVNAAALAVGSVSAGALACGSAVWAFRVHYQPRRLVAARRSEIGLGLPSAVTFLYAMTGGGVDIITAIRSLADEDEVYGEIAAEFSQIVREMDLLGADFQTAIARASDQTPSENLQQFLDNILGVLESGGDVSRFLEDEIDEQAELALQQQETFIERLGLLSEVFIAAFVAGPLFLIITLLVIGLLGGISVLEIIVVIYVVLPLCAAGFFLLVDLVAQPQQLTPSVSSDTSQRTNGHSEGSPVTTDSSLDDDPRYQAYQQTRFRARVRERLSNAVEYVTRQPAYGFGLTAPLGILFAAGVILAGVVQPTATETVARPVWTTVWLAILPGLITTVPISLLYERNRRRERAVIDQFPDVLETLANANRMGVPLTAAFKQVSRSGGSPLQGELTTVRNDIVWNQDPSKAFRRLADRLPIPRVAPTLTIVAEGNRISSELHEVLEIAGKELRIYARQESARRSEVSPYLAIVFIGSLVYLFVIVVLNASFLGPMAETTVPDTDQAAMAPATLSIDVDVYRTVFFHSALIQGIVAGLIGGKLTENSLLSGLKYAIALTVLITGVFLIV